MPYCPTCKKEYPLGTTICVDCNVSLIDNKAADMVSLVSLNNKEQAERFVAYMKDQGIESTYEYGVREDNYRIFVDKKDKRAAMKGFIAFQSAEKRSRNGEDVTPEPIVKPAEKKAEAPVETPKAAEAPKAEEPAEEAPAPAPVEEPKKAPKAKVMTGFADSYEEPDFMERGELPYETSSEPEMPEASIEEPAYEEPAYEEPVVEAPVIEAPAYEEPVVESPVIEEPAPEPVAEEPVAEPETEPVPEVKVVISEEPEEEPAPAAEPEEEPEDEPEIPSEAPEEDEVDDEDEDFGDEPEEDDDDEEEAPQFTANAATRTKLPVRQKEYTPSPETDSVFEAKKAPKRRPSLYEELEKNEEAAAAPADEEPSIDFTPKRPLTAFQFEKKRQEDLENFAKKHEGPVLDTREPEAIAAADGDEEAEGGMKFAFSNYEQQYVVPNYEESEQPKPVYQNNAKTIDWGAGAEDIEVKLETESEPVEEPVAEAPAEEPAPAPVVVEEVEEPAESEPEATVEEPAPAEPEAPIFVETERVEHEELDDANIIDADDIQSFKEAAEAEAPAEDAYVSPVNTADDPLDYEKDEASAEGASNDAFSDFLNNFKKATLSKTRKKTETPAADPSSTIVSKTQKPVAVPVVAKATQKKPVMSENSSKAVAAPEASAPEKVTTETLFDKTEPAKSETIVEEIVPDAKYQSTETADFEAVPSRPTDIQDTKIKVSLDDNIIEEVISDSPERETLPNIEQSSSFANEATKADAAFDDKQPVKKPKRVEINDADIDPEGTYRGFVPDYSPTDLSGNDEPAEESEYDEFKKKVHSRKEENAAINAQIKKEQVRQASLVKDFGKNGKIVFEDTDDLDNYAGFVPDYTPNTTNEAEFDFYKPHQVSSYAKYKKNARKADAEGPVVLTGMRITGEEETDHLFVSHVPASAKRELAAGDLKNASFLLCMSSKRLAKLFNSWMMLNVTQQTVRAFESETATDAQNVERKIAGIKKLLTDNFGELNEVFLDSLVQRYYAKFLEE
ncbi:MAG: hypothetical protein J5645_07275 [Lachnospiraceae bacterium]|nr:hypothetical protein [Lachnospiraceae bacterium]